MKMNWKLLITGILGAIFGMAVSPLERTGALASPVPASAHFQMMAGATEEPVGENQANTIQEIFLLDSETGSVWRYQHSFVVANKDGKETIITQPTFIKVAVEPGK